MKHTPESPRPHARTSTRVRLRRRVLLALPLVALLLTLLPMWLAAQPEGRSPSAVLEGREISVPIAIGTAGPLFGLNAIAEALGLRVAPGEGGSTVLTVANQPVVLAAGSPIVTVGEEILSLSQPVTPGANGLSVPLDFLRKVLGDPLSYTFDWAPESSRLTIARRESRQVPVFVDVVHLQGTTTVVLQFPVAPRYRIDRGQSRITVTPQGDRLAPSIPPHLEDPLVMRVDGTPDQISIVLRPGATFESYTLENPFRLVFDVHQPGQATAGATVPLSGAVDRPGVRTIVIDPGHGGPETGAIGPGGTREKDLNLVLAQALASRLSERLGVRTVLTRSSDVAIPLDTRAAIANQNKADLFLSIHLNSSLGAGAHGAETYFLSTQASDARAASSALAENAGPADNSGAADSALQDLQLMLWDLAQSRSLAESQRVANAIQAELNQALELRDRGVKQAPFRVLMGAAMPAVLVELGFVSNPDEEKKLQDAAYRAQLVDALVRAIGRYKDIAEGRDPAATATPTPEGAVPSGGNPATEPAAPAAPPPPAAKPSPRR